MEKRNVFRVIILSILVSYTVCEVAEEPNHLFAASSPEVTRFKNSSAKHADAPVRSRQHKFPVPISTTTDSFTSDVERIGSLDGRVLPASKNAQKSIKLTKDDKIRNVSILRKIKFAMGRSERRHHVLKPSHGTEMPASVSILKDSTDKEASTFQKTQPSSTTELPYKTKITTPFKLMILPTEETIIQSVDTADRKSDWNSKEDNTTTQDGQKSSHSNDKEDSSSPHGEPKVTGHEGSTPHAGTSAMPQHKMAVHHGVKASSGLRWKVAYDHVKLDDSKKGKNSKNKKKKSHSEDEEPVDSSSTAATVAGILAGMLTLLFIFTGVPRLWRIFNRRWRRHKLGLNCPSTGYFSEEMSEEEILFERSVMERNKESPKDASPRTETETSSGMSQSASSSYQTPDHAKQEQTIWTLTDAPRSTPLTAVPTLDDTPKTEVSTSNEIPEAKSLDSRFTTTSFSPIYDLTDKTDPSSLPLSTQTEQTTPESSRSSNQSAPNLSFLPTTYEESAGTVSLATGSRSSRKYCKTPVAARDEVVITMDDEGDITYSRDKPASEMLSVVKDAGKESSKAEVAITMELGDDEESSVKSESESLTGEAIYRSQEAEMKNVTTGDAIIDIMGSGNGNEETFVINEKSNEAGRAQPRDGVRPKTKREVRWEDESANPEDRGNSTCNNAKIRVLNHKDYKTWKKLQKDVKMKKAQGIKPRDVVPGLQVIRDIYDLPRIPVDSEGGCLCYYCEKHVKRAQREKFFKMPGMLVSFKSKSSANESPSDSKNSSTSSAAKIRVLNHKDYKTWKALQKDIKMKKAQGIKPRDVLPGLQVIRDIYNLPRIPVDSEVGCLCYYCEKHIKRAQREKFFKLPRFDRSMTCA